MVLSLFRPSKEILPSTLRNLERSTNSRITFRKESLNNFSNIFIQNPALPSLGLRIISSSPTTRRNGGNNKSGEYSTADLHSLFEAQIKELGKEREAVFGSIDDIPDGPGISTDQHTDPPLRGVGVGHPSGDNPEGTGWDIEQAYADREALFQFSDEEKSAWVEYSKDPKSFISNQEMMREAVRLQGERRSLNEQLGKQTNDGIAFNELSHQKPMNSTPFTHLTPRGDINMVDVGDKISTRRIAVARTEVVFPPEVMHAFNIKSSGDRLEMIGPKGPIFETAKLAGIMGAKRTSELIPLCHPLQLDKVSINIEMNENKAIIECECRVTHKTGVEMEALVGASITALTIYDMVKAVSHRVEIGQTLLIKKSGGKRDIER